VDTQTIDQAYEQLQVEFQDVAKTVQDLAEKMQAAEKAGDANAHEWLLDLRQIAMDVRDEQTQANLLLQAIHAFISETAQSIPAQPAPTAPVAGYQQPAAASPGGGLLGGGGGPLSGFLGGGFGHAMELGAGIGISSIFN
jgi:hypothetical protein